MMLQTLALLLQVAYGESLGGIRMVDMLLNYVQMYEQLEYML